MLYEGKTIIRLRQNLAVSCPEAAPELGQFGGFKKVVYCGKDQCGRMEPSASVWGLSAAQRRGNETARERA